VLQKYSQADADRIIDSYIKDAGFKRATLLQEKTIPLALQGKNLVVETRNCDGKTATILLSILLRISHETEGTKAVILVSDLSKIKKIRNQYKIFASQLDHSCNLVALGLEENIKRELRLLTTEPDIIVGTPTRIIDHLRRENISLDQVELSAIYETEYSDNGFAKDIQFIFSKMPNVQQTLLFRELLHDDDEVDMYEIVKRPTVLTYSDLHTAEGEHIYFETEKKKQKPDILVKLFYAKELRKSLVICKTETIAAGIEKKLNQEGIPTRMVTAQTPNNERYTISTDFQQGKLQALVTSIGHSSNLTVKGIQHIIYFNPPIKVESYLNNIAHVDKTDAAYTIFIIVSRDELPQLKQLEEMIDMSIKKEENPDENDVIKGTLEKILQRIREEEDPDELTRYKKLIKKHVPITMRAYVSAYLLKESLFGEQKPKRKLKTLFVSVGKNRKVFPKDLARFFSSNLGIKRGEIGNIKVLDSYSFIDIPEEYAQRAINQLNNREFRGRKITVNHARKKDEKNVSVS
jgi:ATP-dependent RNA helicase DeaD